MGKIIILDVDGVLLDYNAQMARIAQKALGRTLKLVDPKAHHFKNAYAIELTSEEKKRAYALFDIDGWESMPAIHRAPEAAARLSEAGHALFCVSSMPERFVAQREINLKAIGVRAQEVIGTDRDEGAHGVNPKADAFARLAPDVVVDDQLRNFEGVSDSVCKVWINRGFHDCPNQGMDPALADFAFGSLHEFVEAFLQNPELFKGRAERQAPAPSARFAP